MNSLAKLVMVVGFSILVDQLFPDSADIREASETELEAEEKELRWRLGKVQELQRRRKKVT